MNSSRNIGSNSMDTAAFLSFQLSDTEHQLRACLEPMSDAQLDHRCTPEAMTPREIAVHLAECYEAFLAECEGRKHEWGSYALLDTSKDNLLSNLLGTRRRAADAAVANPEHAHDAYHVGQMSLVHLATNPDWDAYSIYAH
jgi:hypothetical protein